MRWDSRRVIQYEYCGSPQRNENTASGRKCPLFDSDRTRTSRVPSLRFSIEIRSSGMRAGSSGAFISLLFRRELLLTRREVNVKASRKSMALDRIGRQPTQLKFAIQACGIVN